MRKAPPPALISAACRTCCCLRRRRRPTATDTIAVMTTAVCRCIGARPAHLRPAACRRAGGRAAILRHANRRVRNTKLLARKIIIKLPPPPPLPNSAGAQPERLNSIKQSANLIKVRDAAASRRIGALLTCLAHCVGGGGAAAQALGRASARKHDISGGGGGIDADDSRTRDTGLNPIRFAQPVTRYGRRRRRRAASR